MIRCTELVGNGLCRAEVHQPAFFEVKNSGLRSADLLVKLIDTNGIPYDVQMTTDHQGSVRCQYQLEKARLEL